MTRDPMGLALAMMNRLAGNPLLDRLGLRTPVERTAYHGTRTGFRTLAFTAREFRRVKNWLPRKHLPKPHASDLFDLSLTDDQRMITDLLGCYARDELRGAAAVADEAGEIPDGISKSATDLGLALYAIPEEFGGVAEHQSPVTSVLIAEHLAWGDMGLATALLAPFSVAQAITRWGTGEQQSRYLPAFCGEQPPVATIAIDEPAPLFDPLTLQTAARRTSTGYAITGLKNAVIRGEHAELLLVAAELEGQPRLFIIEAGTPGISIKADPAMGLGAAGTVRLQLENVKLPADALLGDDDFDYQCFLDCGSLLRCGLAIGTSQAILDYVVPYCNDREAFGEPISHRQSVAFMISNLAIETDSMRMLTWRAASRLEQGLPARRETALARLLCNEKAMEAGTNGVQLLGGHGFVKEHPVERWYRDLRSIATQTGGLHA
ncbi:acyl-CoA dehydrogenase family protein [Marinobacter sp. TBZ242]|uniref:Acyl-CoA dehydrogenase family protein n=1 Tax=Marinobacter azerbaijanicus TaxID=3050455 RepID=A0ABT7IA62_9GAMM|nr:acyl-CoA dehydrogenase family protein [Marinobacter sp. TBZ242]MDL0430098.1 acyl-CoA dehydrogenase family protein [Marinobacter sp. TBZ242]